MVTAKELVDRGVCPTCYDKENGHILYGDNRDRMVFENELFECFLAGNPRSAGHTIISTKDHYKDMMEAPEEVIEPLFRLARECMIALKDISKGELNTVPPVGGVFRRFFLFSSGWATAHRRLKKKKSLKISSPTGALQF